MQEGKVGVNRLPDNLVVNLEVTVGNGVAYLVSERQWQLGMLRCELTVVFLDVVTGLAQNLQVADHGILNQLAL